MFERYTAASPAVRAPVRAAMLALALFTTASAPALAGDYDWSGFYVGGVASYNTGGDRLTEFTTATGAPRNMFFDYDLSGIAGGAKAGANLQFDSFVIGAEADFELSRVDGTFIDRIQNLGRGDDTFSWQASLRGRAGFAMERMMIYGTGGVAAARSENKYTLVPFGISEPIEGTHYGWTAGAGVDYAVTGNLIAGIEYRFTQLNDYTNVSKVAFPGISGTQEPHLNSLRVSLSYKF